MKTRFRLALALLAVASLAGGAVVERIVAVVGERPILLSELQRRSRPFRARAAASGATAQQLQKMDAQILQRMVDERLQELAAEKARISITRDEVDAALANVAAGARMSVPDLLREAASQGLPESEYREELRRQLLEGRLSQLRGRGRPRASEAEARAAFEKWSKEPQNAQPFVHVALLPMRVRAEERAADEARVREAKEAIAAGRPFCEVVETYADDASARASCGDRGPQPVFALVPAIVEAAEGLAPGAVSSPVAIGDAVVFVKLLHAPHPPSFDDVRDAMFERATAELVERQRRAWFGELRESHFVDVRM